MQGAEGRGLDRSGGDSRRRPSSSSSHGLVGVMAVCEQPIGRSPALNPLHLLAASIPVRLILVLEKPTPLRCSPITDSPRPMWPRAPFLYTLAFLVAPWVSALSAYPLSLGVRSWVTRRRLRSLCEHQSKTAVNMTPTNKDDDTCLQQQHLNHSYSPLLPEALPLYQRLPQHLLRQLGLFQQPQSLPLTPH